MRLLRREKRSSQRRPSRQLDLVEDSLPPAGDHRGRAANLPGRREENRQTHPHPRRGWLRLKKRGRMDPETLRCGTLQMPLLPRGRTFSTPTFHQEKRLLRGDALRAAGRKGSRGVAGHSRHPCATSTVATGRRIVSTSRRKGSLAGFMPLIFKNKALVVLLGTRKHRGTLPEGPSFHPVSNNPVDHKSKKNNAEHEVCEACRPD
jgi:hypothetical protein